MIRKMSQVNTQEMESKIPIFQRFKSYIRDLNRFAFLVSFTLILSVIAVLLNFGFSFIQGKDIIFMDMPVKDNSLQLFFLAVFVSPVVETYLFQALPYQQLRKVKYLADRNCFILLISAVVFGLSHFHSLFHILYATVAGLVLMSGYMIRITSDRKTFTLIAVSHSILNLGIFLRNLLII